MLFKYLPKERYDVLENMEIRFTPMFQLNDPYESMHLYSVEATQSVIQRLKDDMKVSHLPFEKPEDLFCKHEIENAHISAILNVARMNKYGVLSLSETPYNKLMWSHYCSNEGYVLGFDENHDFFNKEGLGPLSVDYKSKPQELSLDAARSIDKHKFKPEDWSYEREVRFFRELPATVGTILSRQNPDALLQSLFELPASCVKRIYVGLNTGKTLGERLYYSIINHKLDVDIYKLTLSYGSYGFDEEQISKEDLMQLDSIKHDNPVS